MRRLLVDWDYAASGLWLVRGDGEQAAEFGLSRELREALDAWNRDCEKADRRAVGASERARLLEEARALALAAQDELGPSWEVLYSSGPAWHWVGVPTAWG